MDKTPDAPAEASEKKSLFETVVTSTPILLTVIATFILGQSSSEMTKAQYQRAVAGQNQSKVGDQWAFFQAKRIRGTTYEVTAVSLLAQKADTFTPETLADTAEELIREIDSAKKDAGDAMLGLAKEANGTLAKINAALNPPAPAKGEAPVLTPDSVKNAFAALKSYPKHKKEKNPKDTSGIEESQRELLDSILLDIKAFKHEKEVAPRTLGLKPETIDKALEEARVIAAEVAKRGKDIDRVLEQFDAFVDAQAALGREFQRIASARIAALGKAKGEKPESEPVQRMKERLDRIRTLSAKLLIDYKAARFAFDARRYEDDARTNQDAAYLYEVQVLQSSALSDRHLKRSLGFMIAMLVAQVGVTIGSVALALKWKVPVWLVAAFAGLAAIVLGSYVYLELGPLL